MSNLLIKRKSNMRHYRTISRHGCNEPSQENLISELENYRRSLSKRHSPTKLKTPTIKTSRLCNTESFPNTPLSMTQKSPNKHYRNLEKYKLFVDEHRNLNVSNTCPNLASFLTSFKFLTNLTIDIELNTEVVKNSQITSEKALGIHEILLDKMNTKEAQVKNIEVLVNLLKEYCGYFRDILRTLVEKKLADEACNLEMLWKLLLKIFDSSFSLQEKTVTDALNQAQFEVKQAEEKCESSILSQKKNLELIMLSMKHQIADQSKTINSLKHSNYATEKALEKKEAYISNLLEPESQDFSCQRMRNILSKLSSYISESESEQLKQFNTLRDLSDIMSVAETITKSPDSTSISIQTAWSIQSIPLPEFEFPHVFNHPYAVFFNGNVGEIQNSNEKVRKKLRKICENCLNNSDGSLEYYEEVLLSIIQEWKSRGKIGEVVRELVSMCLEEKGIYWKLLKLDGNENGKMIKNLIEVNKELLQLCESGLVWFGKFMDLIQGYVEVERSVCEKVLEKIEYFYLQKIEDRFSSLLARLYLACVKSKTVEILQEKTNLNDLKKIVKGTIPWVVSEADMDFFFQNLQEPSDFPGLFASVSTKAFSIKIDKNKFLFALSEEITARNQKTLLNFTHIFNENSLAK